MQIEALRICNLSISRCSALALAFQGEGWNNQAALIQCPKNDYRCGGCRSASFSHSLSSPSLSPGSPPALPSGGLLAGAILVQLALHPCDGISGELFCAVLPTEISVVPPWSLPRSAQTVCTWNLPYLMGLIRFGAQLSSYVHTLPSVTSSVASFWKTILGGDTSNQILVYFSYCRLHL